MDTETKIFIGSSVKGLDIARAVKANLEYDFDSHVWEHVFGLSKTTIETLVLKLKEYNYGIFIFSADDKIEIKEKHFIVSRDNVIFEAGIFMGMHGQEKCFIITPRGVPDYHNLTDLEGFTTGDYDIGRAEKDPTNALGTASDKIRTAIRKANGFSLTQRSSSQIDYESRVTYYVKKGITFPLKLLIVFTNISLESLTIKNLEFTTENGVPLASGFDENINFTTARPKISLYNSGPEVRKLEIKVEPAKQAMLWIAFAETSKNKLEQLAKQKKVGILRLDLIQGNAGHAEQLTLNI